jgi:ABC-type dipeptide/oligopeptide/nickel transport system permease subunit
MFNKKKKEMDSSTMKAQENQTNLPVAGDFEFVQMDKTIHDVRFQTKPTTFLGDAMRRFAKNRSSVVASVFLGIIIGLAILVPVLNPNDIESTQSYQKDLPPRWSMFLGTGFLDGTVKKSDIVSYNPNGAVTAETSLDEALPVEFQEDAIVKGTKKSYWTTVNASSQYGYGGVYSLRAGNHTDNPWLYTPYSTLDVSTETTVSMVLNPEYIAKEKYKPEYRIFASVAYDSTKPTEYKTIDILPYADSYAYTTDVISATDVKDRINNNLPTGVTAQTSYKVAFGIEIKTNKIDDTNTGDIGVYPAIYFDSFTIKTANDSGDWAKISFSDANELALRPSSTDAATKALAWQTNNFGMPSIYGVHIIKSSFRYDEYIVSFGEKTYEKFSYIEAEPWISNGWMKLDPDDVTTFEILDDARCPIRSIKSINKISVPIFDDKGKPAGTKTAYELNCVVSGYRYRGYSSMPSFIFGTESHGWDYAKYLFTGLRTSLLLGVFSAVINISLGLIWGSVSGYFGGWTDILMERFTEILGGMPWIVVMTLCILTLGQNFWTFLLALCLTGWLGVAGETREQFYRYKGREYVLASRTLGASDARLIFKHILPNGAGTIITGSVLMIPGVIFSEATIAYLGLGLKGMKSFGVALSDAQNVLSSSPYLIISGSIIVSILMICFNLFGNGLRDAFNPSLKGVEE